MLFRPSLPWCFPIREVPFEQKESQEQEPFEQKESQEQEQQQQQDRRKQEEKVAKILLTFLWVSEVTLGSFWAQF